MTLEEFKKGFRNKQICIFAPTDVEVKDLQDAMIAAGMFAKRCSPYSAKDYPYIINHYNCLTGWTGGGSLKGQYLITISTEECLALFDGISEDSNDVDISSLI